MKNLHSHFSPIITSVFLVVGAITIPTVSFNHSGPLMSARAVTTEAQHSQDAEISYSGVTINLTAVVVTALVLGFGYGVLKTFQGGGK